MASLKQRLDACVRKGSLCTADLAHWFELPYPTAQSYRNGAAPNEARRPEIEKRLTWLENAVTTRARLLPMPVSVRMGARKAYLEGVRAGYERKR